MEQLFEAILKIADANPDGFTVDLTTLKKVTKGISVAYLETQGFSLISKKPSNSDVKMGRSLFSTLGK